MGSRNKHLINKLFIVSLTLQLFYEIVYMGLLYIVYCTFMALNIRTKINFKKH